MGLQENDLFIFPVTGHLMQITPVCVNAWSEHSAGKIILDISNARLLRSLSWVSPGLPSYYKAKIRIRNHYATAHLLGRLNVYAYNAYNCQKPQLRFIIPLRPLIFFFFLSLNRKPFHFMVESGFAWFGSFISSVQAVDAWVVFIIMPHCGKMQKIQISLCTCCKITLHKMLHEPVVKF